MRRAKTLLERLSGRQVVDASPALEMLVLDVSAIGPQRPAGERPRIALERPMGNRMERSGPTPGSCPPAGVFPDDVEARMGNRMERLALSRTGEEADGRSKMLRETPHGARSRRVRFLLSTQR